VRIERSGRPEEQRLFDPARFYGSRRIAALNAGARVGIGAHRARIGRCGVAGLAAAAQGAAEPRHH
jgi:hypothetical protein